MSTVCMIAKQIGPNKFKAISCHFDGYLSNVGKILEECYNTSEKIEELLNLGDISSLGRKLKADEDVHAPIRDRQGTVAFARDCGEEMNPARICTLQKLEENAEWAKYIYIYDLHGKWIYSGASDLEDGYREVSKALEFYNSKLPEPNEAPIESDIEDDTILNSPILKL